MLVDHCSLALMQLRDAKASELQLLALRCCGHSTRHCHGAARQPGDRFNVRARREKNGQEFGFELDRWTKSRDFDAT